MNKHTAPITPDQRRQRIVKEVHARGEVAVDALAERFDVSGMTIRRDLQDLADAGQILRTHGGAAANSRVSFEFNFLKRERLAAREKRAIGAAAADMVKDGQSVMLDSGTTTLALARRLKARQDLTVITTSLPIASELFGFENIQLLLLGGFLRHDSPDLTGALTLGNLESLHADVAFIGADGVDDSGNVYNASPALAKMLTTMAASAKRVYIVADHTKLDQRALVRFGNLRRWNGLITDVHIRRAFAARLKTRKINVIKAR